MSLTKGKRTTSPKRHVYNLYGNKVDNRESEIDRLQRMLEGGRPYDVVALEARNRQNERTMSHLNIQVDYLQQKNRELQDQLDRLMSKARSSSNVDVRNLELTKELQDVDLMAQRLQSEKEKVIRAADMEIGQTKAELDKARSQLETMDLGLAQFKQEKDQCFSELESIKKELVCEREENERMTDLIQKIQEDKRRLGLRVNKLTAAERELVLEIDHLRHGSKNGPSNKRGGKSAVAATSAMDGFIKSLEEERDYWKSEVDVLQTMLATSKSSQSPVRTSSSARQRSSATSPLPKTKTSRSTSPVNLASTADRKQNSAQFDSIIRALEDERDHYKQECQILKSARSRSRSSSPTRVASRDKMPSDAIELVQLRRERDDLQKLLDKFERRTAEIQANVRVLTLERDDLTTLYEEAKDELARARRDAVRSPKSPKASLAAQAVLRRVENERDDAASNCRNLTVERDSLRERLKIATDMNLSERAKLEQTIEDLETALHSAELNRNAIEDRLRMSQTYIDTLEARVKEHAAEIAIVQDETAQHRSTASQMRLLADQAERSVKDQQSQLSRRDGDLRSTEDHARRLEDQLSAMKRSSQSDREELLKLRSAIAGLDREKDDLQMAIDEKTESDVKKTEALTTKDRTISDLKKAMIEMETVIGRLKDNVASKEKEVTSLRRQLDGTSDELTEAGRGREVALRENRRLQDDLATMTRENQSLNQELDEALQEREQLKQQTQEYISEVKRCEELMTSKEQERADILEQYRSLSHEAERYETQTHHLESEGSNLKLELLSRDSEVRRLRDKVDQAERELQEHLANERAYEVQLSNMAKSVATLEETIRRLEEEKHNVLLDLSAIRDLCGRLESTKDNLQRQLMAKSLDQEKLQTLLNDLKHESDMLRSQVTNERSTKQNLEGLLQENRNKEWQGQLAAQEKEAEIQLLRDRLQLNDSKIESQTRELNQHRTRSIEIESDLERLKRQLISERFERERAVQELRRNGLSLPGEGSRLGSISPNSARARSPLRQSPTAIKSTAETTSLHA